MLYSCAHVTTVGVKEIKTRLTECASRESDWSEVRYSVEPVARRRPLFPSYRRHIE